MGAFRSTQRTPSHRDSHDESREQSRGDANSSAPANAPAAPTDPARVVTLDDGTRWLATVVARLVSEDMIIGYGSARLLVRLESLTVPDLPAQVATVRARELHSVDDEVLRALVATSAVRDYEPPHRNRA
jgi:hypothetical protein